MKKLLQNNVLFVLLLSLIAGSSFAQTSVQNFGNATGVHSSSSGTAAFLPNPTSGTTFARAGATVPNAPITLATAANPLGTAGTYVRGTASTSTSITRLSPIVGYTGGAEFYTSFKVLFGDANGASGNFTGSWTFYQGSGGMYTGTNEVVTADIFSGLRFTFGNGNVSLSTRQGSSLVTTNLTTTTLNQATVYTVEIIANNKTSGTINYNYAGAARSVAVQRMDLYVNGSLIGDDLPVSSGFTNGANISSMTFNGVSSAANNANIFLDDIVVYNAIPAAINVPAAIMPNAPVVSNPQISSLNVTIDTNAENGNGTTVQYAIQETNSGNYVQANGTLAATPVWQTAATWGTAVVSGLNSNTQYIFRLNARNAANVETGFGASASGTTLQNISPNLSLVSPLAGFGNVCTNASVTGSFTFDGANLDGTDIIVTGPAGYSFSLTQNGTYTPSVNVSYVGGSINDQVVWVQFSPTLVQSYNGNIALSGGNLAVAFNVAATGSGINNPVVVTTGSASGISAVQATAAGSFLEGCSTATAYGIEYSTTNNFVNGTGTQVASINALAGAFTSLLTNLSANTVYYFKAYATDNTGTVYGTQQTFTTLGLSAPLNLNSTGITQNSFVANWSAVPGATSYAIDVKKTDPFVPAPSSAPWINEFHYDNNGADTNEFIEIIVPDGYAGTGLTLSLYNGSNNQTYGTATLAGMTLGADTPVYNVYSITFPQDGLQNGAPDGIALSDNSGLIQFLSYEGTMTASNGPANGVLSTDVVVGENNSNSGASLHLVGTGSGYADFTWAVSAATNSNTKGAINSGQTISAATSGTFIIDDFNVGNVTSYEVTGLDAETTYYYRVRAVSANSTSLNSETEEVVTLRAAPTFGAISQVAAVVCDGSDATFNVTGLLPDLTSAVTFNINGGTPVTVNINANASGFGSFDYTLTAADNGHTLTVTSVDRVDFPGSPVTVTTNNTVVLSVNAYVTYYRDFDNDTYGDLSNTIQACDGVPAGYVLDATDCDDADNTRHAVYAYYEDNDGDGFGGTVAANICAANPLIAPAGFSTNDDDCNDNADTAYPGATEIGYNLVDDDCDGSIDEGFPPKITIIQGAQCNMTLASIDTQIVANIVAGAQGYHWKVTTLTGPNAGAVQEIDTALRVMKITQLANYAFATQYKIEIGVYYAGFLQPYNASNCNITTPAAATQLSVCGQTLTNMSNAVYANLVPYAAGYRFRITDPVNGANTQVLDRATREFKMSQISNFVVQYNKQYNVEVAVKNTDGTWMPFGTMCSVTTPAFPTTSLQDSQCDDFQVETSNTPLYAYSYPGAISYVFQVTGPGITTPLEVSKSTRSFNLNDFPSLAAGATYDVRVRLVFNLADPEGPFGKTCTFVTPGLSRTVGIKNAFDVTAYPNPFADNFSLDLVGASSETVGVKIYDMTGRLLGNISVKSPEVSALSIGENYPSGVYNVIVTQGDNSKTLRIIKR